MNKSFLTMVGAGVLSGIIAYVIVNKYLAPTSQNAASGSTSI